MTTNHLLKNKTEVNYTNLKLYHAVNTLLFY